MSKNVDPERPELLTTEQKQILPVILLSSVFCRTHHLLGPTPRNGLTSHYTETKINIKKQTGKTISETSKLFYFQVSQTLIFTPHELTAAYW